MSKRAVAIWIAVVAVLATLLLLMPRAERGGSTLAFRRFLANTGVRVRDAPTPPDDGAFVLLRDLRGEHDAQALLEWADDGGRLVVADPASAIVATVGARPEGPVGLVGGTTLTPGCAAEEVVGVDTIVARASDWTLAPSAGFVSCFPSGGGSYVLVRRHGEGALVLLGGTSALTNELLRERDNAVLAARIVGGAREVVFGPPIPPSAAGPSAGLWASLSPKAKVAIVAVCLAAVVFAFVRGRRLGRPVEETPIAPIPASELSIAVGRLYRRARDPGYAGRLMREATEARLTPRFGGIGGREELPAAVAATTGMPGDRVREVFGDTDPATDEDLIRLGNQLREVERRIEERPR